MARASGSSGRGGGGGNERVRLDAGQTQNGNSLLIAPKRSELMSQQVPYNWEASLPQLARGQWLRAPIVLLEAHALTTSRCYATNTPEENVLLSIVYYIVGLTTWELYHQNIDHDQSFTL